MDAEKHTVMYSDVTDHLLYILLATTSLGVLLRLVPLVVQ